MSEPRLISPMLDNFAIGDPISNHNGVRCCPAMDNNSEEKYIVKIISSPATPSQLEAMILSGAYASKEEAQGYYKEVADGIEEEIGVLQKLSQLEGFLPLDKYQVVPMEDGSGYDIYMLSKFRNTLEQKLRHCSLTQLEAINLGLDICAALSVCRRSGYLYTNLKPENIYLTAEKGYRIGDIGFTALNSLKYSSLPDRNRSSYTAPEVSDAFANLNTTMDIYALGLILYQVFNDGKLPVIDEDSENNALAAPAYADYEMAEIILKACAQDPEQRWQDPVDMGQAIVGYMQRNGANDTPITPVAETKETEIIAPAPVVPELNPEDITEEQIFVEDAEGNLTILDDGLTDETAPGELDEDIEYFEVTEDVNEILNQADDLLAHPTPEPVVQPEPIDVPIPPPLPIEEEIPEATDELPEEEAADEAQEETVSDAEETDSEAFDAEAEESEDVQEEEAEDAETVDEAPKPAKKSHWVRNIFLVFLALALIAAGFFFYTGYYLQPIESIDVDEGTGCNITVNVKSGLDESKLIVVCSDTYGNQLKQPVKNGKAVFLDLAPNAAYTVKVITDGFHKLTGETSAAFTTPVQTNIVQLNAVTGTEDGSMVIGFAIEGPDAKQWQVSYSAKDETAKSISFAGHMVTITGLTVGKEYDITLKPDEELLITGVTQLKHTASAIIKPENLQISGIMNGKLTATWTAPKDTKVESWTVRCYNDKDYDQTQVVSELSAVFDNIDPAKEYTVEVTASGMSVSERAFAPANSITITDLAADTKNENQIILSWKTTAEAPKDGWKIVYTVDASPSQEVKVTEGMSATIPNKVPGATYHITVETAAGAPALGGKLSVTIPQAAEFEGYNLTKSNLTFNMCRTPSKKNWDKDDLSSKDYTSTFKSSEKASFLVKSSKSVKSSSDEITTLFVIRNDKGEVVAFSESVATWKKMWSGRYCELNIPSLVSTAGNYTMSVYFNGELAHEQSIKITK